VCGGSDGTSLVIKKYDEMKESEDKK